MKRFIPGFILMLIVAFALLPSARAAAVLDRIVAVVNGDPIMQSELDEAVFQAMIQLRNQGIKPPPQSALTRKVLDQLIAEKVQLQRARQRGIDVTDEEINAQLAEIARMNGRTLAQLREALESQTPGSFEKLRERIRRQLMIQKLRQIEVLQNVVVTRDEVRALLRQKQPGGAERYRIRHIMIRIPPAPSRQQLAQARARAEQIHARLKQGADFARMAVEHSAGEHALKGGDLGWRKASELPELFVRAIRDLKPGELSPVLKSAAGFHILKLVDREGGEPATDARTEEAAMQALRLRKANELLDVWLQRLIDEAHVEIYLDDGATSDS